MMVHQRRRGVLVGTRELAFASVALLLVACHGARVSTSREPPSVAHQGREATFPRRHCRVDGAAVDSSCWESCDRVSERRVVCTIQNPVVTKRLTQYASVRFQPGDTIRISARGCVNTFQLRKALNAATTRPPNIAQTWRRYVTPLGPESQRLYFGTLFIPGVTASSEPIRSVTASNGAAREDIVIPRQRLSSDATSGNAGDVPLMLGYVDRPGVYFLHSYREFNAGWLDQCSAPRDTEVVVTVDVRRPADLTQEASTDRSSALRLEFDSLATKPFDLVTDAVDENGLPLDPTFAHQSQLARLTANRILLQTVDTRPTVEVCGRFPYQRYDTPLHSYPVGIDFDALSDCTTQQGRITVDESSGLSSVWCGSTNASREFHGHINWFPVTYRGRLFFDAFSPGDGDYALNLATDERGQTSSNGRKRIHIEFNGSETVKRFTTSWWMRFSEASNAADSAMIIGEPRSDTTGTEAIVTGLLGLDAVHETFSELHPVYAMAVHTQRNVPDDDVWQIFVRNWGNEGECSQDMHYLDLPENTYRLVLPWRMLGDGTMFDSVEVRAPTTFRARRIREHDWASEAHRPIASSLTHMGALRRPHPETPEQRQSGSFVVTEAARSEDRDVVQRLRPRIWTTGWECGSALVIDFPLLPPEDSSVTHGELHLRWFGPRHSVEPACAVHRDPPNARQQGRTGRTNGGPPTIPFKSERKRRSSGDLPDAIDVPPRVRVIDNSRVRCVPLVCDSPLSDKRQ